MSEIRLRGARQNNLRGVDLDLPLGRLIVVTGPSGSGKSSLAFDTLYAEGQRRYIETFSPYTRQFLDRMDKPRVEAIEGIPPAIAIQQANTVRTTRSTVGTITEINDYLKLLFARAARCHCPECGREVRPETAAEIVAGILRMGLRASALITFSIPAPQGTQPADFFSFLNRQGYLRVLLYGRVLRTDEETSLRHLPALAPIIQDRVEPTPENAPRLREAVEAALRLGQGRMAVWDGAQMHPFSSGWHCAHCDRDFRPPSPGLFSFNNPLGACPTCRGFGRVIGIDWGKVLPDRSLSIAAGVVRPFQSGISSECQRDLLKAARRREVDVACPFEKLPKADQDWVINGEGTGSPDEVWEAGGWYGIRGFFQWLEGRSYKMHVRILLNRYRAYTKCEDCGGGRFQPETLNYRIAPSGLTLPEVLAQPAEALCRIFEEIALPPADPGAAFLRDQVLSRARYIEAVGLGYLTLNRLTRTLSGGELERVNLTTCLGAALTNTLFVLDEPSVGLHPRDTERLVGILKALRDKGNTVLVVEHEEAVIRGADHLVDIGPGGGANGGRLVYSGPTDEFLEQPDVMASLTRDYLIGAKRIAVPESRRRPSGWIRLRGIRHNNLANLDVDIPLGVLCCVTGVSGSGKSSLVHGVLHPALARDADGNDDRDVGSWRTVSGAKGLGKVLLVDQSPLARTPRSTPAVYVGVYDAIRKLFGTLPEALGAGLSPGAFSFNSGDGRCGRCGGLGFEKVEMQFLSDLFLRCPECEGRRFQPHVLKILHKGRSIADVLGMTISAARTFFADHPGIEVPLRILEEIGLGYLQMGQPLNELSGGESQRLKLAAHVGAGEGGDLLLFDEPTTGLHFDDIARLLRVFQKLIENGNSLVVVEHNLEVIKCADWILDLGPEAGVRGGRLVAAGTPEEIAANAESRTGHFLGGILGRGSARGARRPSSKRTRARRKVLPSEARAIRIRGAREHNLKSVNVDIPREKMVVVTGLSGSGKSTLAFDILFAEGQRRFLDSMSAYARQFVDQMEKPDVDAIEGLPPSVAIEQRVTRGGGKSTVATVTEIYHFLRLLFSKLGTQHCPKCQLPVVSQTESEIAASVRRFACKGAVRLYAPVIRARKGYHTQVAQWAARNGIASLLVDGHEVATEDFRALERYKEHSIDALVGVIRSGSKDVPSLVRRALDIGKGAARLVDAAGHSHPLNTEMNCPGCGEAFEPLDPRLFSFNSPHGWCPQCRGYGVIRPALDASRYESVLDAELAEERAGESDEAGPAIPCPSCAGTRLNDVARSVFLSEMGIADLTASSASRALTWLEALDISGPAARIAGDILPEIRRRLEFLGRVGLEYLSLDRAANTLSGGESQRIRLAAQLGSNLRGVLYVLDEPTIGLHARDNARLLDALRGLASDGNSLVIVEHDEETMRRADHIIDLGPGAGARGGEITAVGTLEDILANPRSQTGAALREPLRHPLRGARRSLKDAPGWVRVTGARLHNLKNLEVRFPVNRLTVVTGISGSGKSSLIRGVVEPAVRWAIARKRARAGTARTWVDAEGADLLGAVLEVDQSPIGKTSRSTPATYIKVFDAIRQLYASLPASRVRGYSSSRFSFNNEGGRCETCKGQGVIRLEMNFLPPAHMPCQECRGRRYNPATLEIEFDGKSIGDVMRMTAEEAAEFFAAQPRIRRSLDLLVETGLGYLELGQPSPTLSGGEAQRIKLVTEIARRPTGRAAEIRATRRGKSTLYILEEPTIGLHARDVARLLDVLHRLVDEGGTVIVIEHHLDVIAEADYLLDLGPEAGDKGGRLIASGTPEQVARSKVSRTAPFLREMLPC